MWHFFHGLLMRCESIGWAKCCGEKLIPKYKFPFDDLIKPMIMLFACYRKQNTFWPHELWLNDLTDRNHYSAWCQPYFLIFTIINQQLNLNLLEYFAVSFFRCLSVSHHIQNFQLLISIPLWFNQIKTYFYCSWLNTNLRDLPGNTSVG